jgi:RecJ-like exonuclease
MTDIVKWPLALEEHETLSSTVQWQTCPTCEGKGSNYQGWEFCPVCMNDGKILTSTAMRLDFILVEIETLRAQLAQARADLKAFGEHDSDCASRVISGDQPLPCTCGFNAALSRMEVG